MPRINRPKAGDPISATMMGQIIDELERLGKWSVAAPLELKNASTGFALSCPELSAIVWVKVTGNATGGGKYNGKIVTRGATAPDLSTGLAEGDFGTIPSANNCYILNSAEVGKSTHDLTSGTPIATMFPGVRTGQNHTDGLPFIRINGNDWEACAEE